MYENQNITEVGSIGSRGQLESIDEIEKPLSVNMPLMPIMTKTPARLQQKREQ